MKHYVCMVHLEPERVPPENVMIAIVYKSHGNALTTRCALGPVDKAHVGHAEFKTPDPSPSSNNQ